MGVAVVEMEGCGCSLGRTEFEAPFLHIFAQRVHVVVECILNSFPGFIGCKQSEIVGVPIL